MKELYIDDLNEDMIRELLEDEDVLPPDVVSKLKKKLDLTEDDDASAISLPIQQHVRVMKDCSMSEDAIREELMDLYDLSEEETKKYI